MARQTIDWLADEDALRKVYRLNTLDAQEWEDADQDGSPGEASKLEDDPLGLRSSLQAGLDWNPEQRSATSTTSKSFSAKTFLATMHPTASFPDLKRGGQHLQESLEQRSEALKVLVEQEFDRFSGVKAATESVYEEMKVGPLHSEADYSTADLKDFLQAANLKADQIYTPLLENRRKAERLRSTLGVFERSKFFFNLPATLVGAIETGRHNNVLLAYKRGRNMLDSRPGQILGLPAPANADEAVQHKRIFEKVWSQVERIIRDFQAGLEQKLLVTSASEDAERIIEMLLELDSPANPAWTYLETQHRRVLRKVKEAAENSALSNAAFGNGDNVSSPNMSQVATEVAKQLDFYESPDCDLLMESATGAATWASLLDLVKSLCRIVTSELPQLWSVAKGYGEGKYDRNLPQDVTPGSPAGQELIDSIVRSFDTAISQAFELGNVESSDRLSENFPTFAPLDSTALAAAHYLLRIHNQLLECVHDLGNLDLPTASAASLQTLVDSTRRAFVYLLCTYWLRDAKIFYHLENWRTDPGEPTTTFYLRRIDAFQMRCLRNAFRLAGGIDDANSFSTPEMGQGLPPRAHADSLDGTCVHSIQSAFLDALYAFLDGLVHIAFAQGNPVDEDAALEITLPENGVPALQNREYISDTDIHILLTINNLASLKTLLVPRMLNTFSRAFRINLRQETETLMDVIRQLDKILFEDFVKRKADNLGRIVNSWVLGGSVDWSNAPKPIEVHSLIFDALLSLVVVHAQVSSVASQLASGPAAPGSLVHRTLSALIQELANQCLRAFGHVKRFGMGGMLQATLEIEFMHQTLAPFVTAEADSTMQDIYKKISTAYERAAETEGASNLQEELEALKRTLQMSRRSTALTFLCFRRPKGDQTEQTR